jgi:membrane-associated phospholipid phosphatase
VHVTSLRAPFRQSTISDSKTRFLPGAAVCFVLFVVCYVAFVGTDWGHRLDDAALMAHDGFSWRLMALDVSLLKQVSLETIIGAAGFLFIISILRRSLTVGVIVVAGFFTSVLGAEGLKELLPWRALVPEDTMLVEGMQLGTFPSGHATIATALGLGLLLVWPARWRSWSAIAAGVLSSFFACSVVFAAWHRASDALGALAWSGVCMNLAAAIAVRLRGRPAISNARPRLSTSVVLGIVLLVAFFLVAATAAPQHPVRDLPFFLLIGLIIAGSFTLTAWYSRQLEAVDFSGS